MIKLSMKNSNFSEVKKKLITRYLSNEEVHIKSTNINILLNRVKLKQKNEKRKKLYFSAFASTGLLLFGLIIF